MTTQAEENMKEILKKRGVKFDDLPPMDTNKPLGQKPEEKFREEVKEQLDRIENDLRTLNNRIDLIFGTNVIVDGRFVPISQAVIGGIGTVSSNNVNVENSQ